MENENDFDALLIGILESVKTIALVGASPKSERPSYIVMAYLLKHGYDVMPVNPGYAEREILGQTVYASLDDVPAPIDMVDIFRASKAAGDVVRKAVALAADKGIQVVWMQEGVIHDEAKAEAENAGLVVIQDHCPKKEHERLLAP